jgi:CSLREA domain-containing protein
MGRETQDRTGRLRALAKAVLAVAVAALLLPGSAAAAVIAPNTTADDYDDTTPDATCSLREAVQSADQGANFGGCVASGPYGTDTVRIPAGDYVLTIPPAGSNLGDTGDLNTFSDMTIEAVPGAVVTIDGNGTDRILRQSASGSLVTLRGLTLTGGFVDNPDPGSAVGGGAISTSGGSSMAIVDSTIWDNRADGFGGGISASGPLTLTNVTISGNTTTELAGGGIEVSGASTSLSLEHVTVTDNHSLIDDPAQLQTAGGISTSATTATVHNSIIAGNTSASATTPAPDCEGAITSQGGNVVGDTTGCTLTSMAGDALDMPALLAALADNGGTSRTHALLTASPAIDRGVAACAPVDQRGYPRPFPSGSQCDSGAYELFLCDGSALNAPGPFTGCPVPPTTTTQVPGTTPSPCITLRKKLKAAKKAGNKAKVRKLRRKLRRLGC